MSKLPDKVSLLFLMCLTLVLGIWSPHQSFTATPKYWWDESFAVETARTILEQGRIDITVAPHTPSNKAIILSSNGFPLSVPLAGVYLLFGFGITQTRIYMLCWILATVAVLYWFLKNFFDKKSAFLGTLLVTTFASFYANGRTATGDIPGFFFLLLGLFLCIKKENFVLGGIVLGLAAITKTSLYHMIFPAITIVYIVAYGKKFILPTLKTAIGSITVALVWGLLLLPHPYAFSDLAAGFEFYDNPINKPSLLDKLPVSLVQVFSSSTILYFLAFLCLILFAHKKYAFSREQKMLITFALAYIFFQFFVFLRSPGWHRYLLASELLILMLLYPSLRFIGMLRTLHRLVPAGIIALLAFAQTTHYLLFSNIFSNPSPTKIADAINKILEKETKSTVGFINDPITASQIDGRRKYQIVHVGGNTYAGKHPLEYKPAQLPTYMIQGDKEHKEVLDRYYRSVFLLEGLPIYKRIDL
ncbi:MAG: hypothetical protein EXS68_02705 [Candidatus Ryanbacteria bacterium]|nr:hypothetical protein [Candidatus Ryanbacteria bacterium]